MTIARICRALALACGVLAALPGRAQESDPAQTQREALRSLPVACAGYAALCPQLATGPVGTRAMLICLKDHTVDVSLKCRHAIAAAQQTAAAPR